MVSEDLQEELDIFLLYEVVYWLVSKHVSQVLVEAEDFESLIHLHGLRGLICVDTKVMHQIPSLFIHASEDIPLLMEIEKDLFNELECVLEELQVDVIFQGLKVRVVALKKQIGNRELVVLKRVVEQRHGFLYEVFLGPFLQYFIRITPIR